MQEQSLEVETIIRIAGENEEKFSLCEFDGYSIADLSLIGKRPDKCPAPCCSLTCSLTSQVVDGNAKWLTG